MSGWIVGIAMSMSRRRRKVKHSLGQADKERLKTGRPDDGLGEWAEGPTNVLADARSGQPCVM